MVGCQGGHLFGMIPLKSRSTPRESLTKVIFPGHGLIWIFPDPQFLFEQFYLRRGMVVTFTVMVSRIAREDIWTSAAPNVAGISIQKSLICNAV